MQSTKIIFFLFLLLDVCRPASSQTLYISPIGDDRNPGTKAQPMASLEGARDRLREIRKQKVQTDTVWVKIEGGTYYLQHPFLLSPMDSGTDRSPVIYTGDETDRPLFCGGKEAGTFEKLSPNLWRMYIPEVAHYGFYFEQLYINGERRFRAQTPNRGSFYQVKRIEETALDTTGKRIPTLAAQKVILSENECAWMDDLQKEEQKDALIVFYHKWDNTRRRIFSINPKDTAVYTIGEGMKPWNPINSDSRYYIENYAKALDSPGEWYLNRDGYLYYIPMTGETPENVKCIFPVTEHFVLVEGESEKPVRQINFQNLRFEVSAYNTPALGNEPAQAAAPFDASIRIDYADSIRFLNCEIAHTGLHGIWFRNRCFGGKVEHCHLYDLGGGGVKIGTTDLSSDESVTRRIIVNNNIIHHGGYLFPCGVGVIIFNGSDNEITHNEIADFRYSGVSVGWVWGYAHSPSKRNKISYNHIHHLGWGELCDMGGVYTLGASEGTIVSNNVIHHIYAYSYGGWGLYTDEGSYGVRMENNLVYQCKNAGFHQHYGKANVITNNIFADNLLSQMQFTRPEEHLSLSFTHNIVYYEKGKLYMSKDTGRWLAAKVDIDYNCFWNPRSLSHYFNGKTLAEWKKLGRDRHSVIADPLFIDPAKGNFHFRKQSVARKIQFKPFDYTRAGVYGSKEWIQKAEMPSTLIDKYDQMVDRLASERETD